MVKVIIFSILIISFNLFAGERFPVPYIPDIDLTKKAVSFKCSDIDLNVDITRPLIPFQNLNIFIRANKDKIISKSLKIKAKMNMKMDMGNYNYDFKLIDDKYVLKFILPKCIWGDKRWYLKLEVFNDKKICEKVLLFDMIK